MLRPRQKEILNKNQTKYGKSSPIQDRAHNICTSSLPENGISATHLEELLRSTVWQPDHLVEKEKNPANFKLYTF